MLSKWMSTEIAQRDVSWRRFGQIRGSGLRQEGMNQQQIRCCLTECGFCISTYRELDFSIWYHKNQIRQIILVCIVLKKIWTNGLLHGTQLLIVQNIHFIQVSRYLARKCYLGTLFLRLQLEPRPPWSSEPRVGLAACRAKGVPSFLSYFKTLSVGPALGIELTTSCSAVKRSTDWANPAANRKNRNAIGNQAFHTQPIDYLLNCL